MIKKNANQLPEKKKKKTGPEDEELWTRVMSSIEPLQNKHKNIANIPSGDNPKPTVAEDVKKTRSYTSVPREDAQSPVRPPSLPELSHNHHPGLDKSSSKKLKKGNLAIEGRMDLHGMTQAQAHRALDSFIAGSQAAGKRCVLVITGKGLAPDGSTGVLRREVPRWLNESPNRTRVLAFSHATPRDGGEGALYIMLKRLK